MHMRQSRISWSCCSMKWTSFVATTLSPNSLAKSQSMGIFLVCFSSSWSTSSM